MIEDRYDRRPAHPRNALDLFPGTWTCRVPTIDDRPLLDLDNDKRILAFDEAIGGFDGKTVIELGPLEGVHTYIMSQLGAAEITSVESNKDAFLRCLIVQNATRMQRTQFLLGDCLEYLRSGSARVDVIVASGVLYHMQDPLALLSAMVRRTKVICLWTHYFDPSHHNCRQAHFSGPLFVEFQGQTLESYTHRYINPSQSFCGGNVATSTWLTKPSLLSAMKVLGLDWNVIEDNPAHDFAPCILIVAHSTA
jgi:hypothetical protein